jgi:hypothetical protein
MREIPATVEANARSETVVTRFSTFLGDMPVYVHTQLTMGMSIVGKISIGIWLRETMPNKKIDIAMTINV